MGMAAGPELQNFVEALKARIGPVSTTAEAEHWWPLALHIDASMSVNDTLPADSKASHSLLWAVSDVIRALKRSHKPDLGRVVTALSELERRLPATPVSR
jgi:hypothetical protein